MPPRIEKAEAAGAAKAKKKDKLNEMSLEEPNFKMMMSPTRVSKAKSKAFRSQNTVGTENRPKPGTFTIFLLYTNILILPQQ